jgi:hypothetical protein
MRNSVVLPVMGVLTVIAGAVGLQLGESAIAQIDPVHFSGPRPALRDVSHERRPEPPPSYASAYGWAEGYGARDADCADCAAPDSRVAYAPLSAPVTGAPDHQPWRAPITYDRMDYEPEVDRSEWAEISRYRDYPVTQEQADRAASLPAAQPAAAPDEPEPGEPAGL